MATSKNVLLLLVTLLFAIAPAPAQNLWNGNGVSLRDESHVEWQEWAAQNGSGDHYIVWQDSRAQYPRIYGQKFSAQGVRLWDRDAELVHAPGDFSPVIQMVICATSDDGLAIAWGMHDYAYPGPIIKAQKVDANGNVLWEPTGVPVGTFIWAPGDAEGSQSSRSDGAFSIFNLVADSSGGIFACWFDWIHIDDQEGLFAKHLLSNGSLAPGWSPRGNVIKADVLSYCMEYCKFTCDDDANGFIVSWQEYLGGSQFGAYAQRVDGEANFLWGINGLEISNNGDGYSFARVSKDGSSGAFFVWEKFTDLYMQRVDHQGNILWQANGIPLIQANNEQKNPQISYDGFGGALCAWEDERNGTWNPDIYGQRVDGEGNKLWAPLGAPITLASGYQANVKIDADGAGGFYAIWEHWLSQDYSHPDAYIQHLTALGQPAWSSNGILLRGSDDIAVYGEAVAGTDDGGAIYFWLEEREDLSGLYLQKTDDAGQFQFPNSGRSIMEAIAGEGEEFELVPMGQNRFLSVWRDSRKMAAADYLVYYQVCDLNGNFLLPENGAQICDVVEDEQGYPKAAATLDGGAILTWWDYRAYNNMRIFAQKIDSQGRILWTPEGIQAGFVDQLQWYQFACSDDAGGGYVAWTGRIATPPYDEELYIQRLDANGNRLFGDNAFRLTYTVEEERIINLIPDGQDGAIIIYEIYLGPGIFAKRISSTGVILWTSTVNDVGSGFPVAIPAHEGGAIVAWEEIRSSLGYDIYAQKFDNSGTMLWAENGIPVAALPDHQVFPKLAEDDSGFVYVGWHHSYAIPQLRCQRLSPEGLMQFPAAGITVCDNPGAFDIVADGSGGALFTWTDLRNLSISQFSGSDIYGIHLNAQGQIANPFWVPNGNPICSAFESQYDPRMVSDGLGGAVLGWDDSRGLYLQRVNDFVAADGMLAEPVSQNGIGLLQICPNPFNPVTRFGFSLPEAAHVTLQIFDLQGRLVATLAEGMFDAGSHEATFDASHLASGIYLYHLTAGSFDAGGKMVLMK